MTARDKVFCFYPGCSTVLGEGLSLFTFPNKINNTEMFKKWVEAIGRDDVTENDDFRYRKICQNHFSPHEYKRTAENKGHLNKKAVPKRNDPKTPINEEAVISERKRKLFEFERIMRKDKRYVCKFCGRQFKSFDCRKCHEEKIHLNIEPKPDAFKCNFCDKTFKFKNSRRTHIYSHHTDRVKCQICDKKCTVNRLREHMKSHSGIKPYQCNFCQKPFINNSNRKKHELVMHSKEIIALKRKESEGQSLQMVDNGYNGVKIENDFIVNKAVPKNKIMKINVEKINEQTHNTDLTERVDSYIGRTEKLRKLYGCNFCEKQFKCNRNRKLHEYGKHSKEIIALRDKEIEEMEKQSEIVADNSLNVAKAIKTENDVYSVEEVNEKRSTGLLNRSRRLTRTTKPGNSINHYQCNFCKKKFKTDINRENHEVCKHNKEINALKDKDKNKIGKDSEIIPDNSFNIVKTIKTENENNFVEEITINCELPNDTVTDQSNAMETDKISNCFPCNFCKKPFRSDINRKNHELSEHSKEIIALREKYKNYIEKHNDNETSNSINNAVIIKTENEIYLSEDINESQSTESLNDITEEVADNDNSNYIAETEYSTNYYQCNFCRKQFKSNVKRKNHELFKHSNEIIALRIKDKLEIKMQSENMVSSDFTKEINESYDCRLDDSTENMVGKNYTVKTEINDEISEEYGTKSHIIEEMIVETHDNHLMSSPLIKEEANSSEEPQLIPQLLFLVKTENTDNLNEINDPESGINEEINDETHNDSVISGSEINQRSNFIKTLQFACKHCGELFRCLKNMKHHVKTIHLKFQRKPNAFKCKFCDKIFRFRSLRRYHAYSEHIVRIKCSLCEKKIISNRFKKHLRFHSSEKEFSCNFCRKRFSLDNLRRDHEIMQHSKEIIALSKKNKNLIYPKQNCLVIEDLKTKLS